MLTKYTCASEIKKFHENPSIGNPAGPYGRTDRHDEANNLFAQLCDRA